MCYQNWENRTLFHGDNLKFLRRMNSNSVDLIATDPPFNKGRDFYATPESLSDGASFQDRWSWNDDVQKDWLDKIEDDFPKVMALINGTKNSYGGDMAAFLCFMGVRLLEMHRILKPTGSIYLHCDHTASHYLKALLDSIFGKNSFRNEVVWCYTSPGSPNKKQFNRKHDTIFWYSKGEKWTFNCDEVRLPCKGSNQIPKKAVDSGSSIDEENMAGMRKLGKIPESWWAQTEGNGLGTVSRSKQEYVGYPTQKPVELYKRIIMASSNPHEVVLDPFCGCATTLVAAEILQRKWVGIDIWEMAHEIAVEQLRKAGLLGSDSEFVGRNTFSLRGKLHYRTDLPVRTDDGFEASPGLKPTISSHIIQEPEGPKLSRSRMLEILIDKHGRKCMGCDRRFDDERYLQLDHNTPRSDGGVNHISNRILLCWPCNIKKNNSMTLSGLRKSNEQNGFISII